MAGHDEYGKHVLQEAVGTAFVDSGPAVHIDYGAGGPARIDGVIGRDIAVEVESRVSKQVRGAVLDLLCHECDKKLLVLLPVHMNNPMVTAAQCRTIMKRFLDPADFRVVVLAGSGGNEALSDDAALVRAAVTLQAQLRNLGRRLLLARGQEEHEFGFGREFVTDPGPGLAAPGP